MMNIFDLFLVLAIGHLACADHRNDLTGFTCPD